MRFLRVIGALILASLLWLPAFHYLFKPKLQDYRSAVGIPPKTRMIAARHLNLWLDPALRAAELGRMRHSNAEWDFMGRTYLVLSLANMGFREPNEKARYLEIIDAIIDETLRLEREKGIYYFLMDYAKIGNFESKVSRSLFEDGEIAMMLAARRLLEEKDSYKPLLHERVETMIAYMEKSPVLSGESYPDECWMFCNTVALASIRMADVLDGSDHDRFIQRWLNTARARLMDKKTGLLFSSYTFQGAPLDGPEGSSLWMVAHCLQIVDRPFAEDQYHRAKKELEGRFLGLGFAREWPKSWVGTPDVDSGPIISVLKISFGSSGLAILGASSFGDDAFLSGLLTSLNFGAFPSKEQDTLRYCASNQVGDAVLLYALVQGPLWVEVERRRGGLALPDHHVGVKGGTSQPEGAGGPPFLVRGWGHS